MMRVISLPAACCDLAKRYPSILLRFFQFVVFGGLPCGGGYGGTLPERHTEPMLPQNSSARETP